MNPRNVSVAGSANICPDTLGPASFDKGVWPEDHGATTTAASNAEQPIILSSAVFIL
jgi:hypothetical protein